MSGAVSFGFSKVVKKEKLTSTAATVVEVDDGDTAEFASVSAIEGSTIVGDGIQKPKKEELVIPLIAKNRWRIPTGSKRKVEESAEPSLDHAIVEEVDEAKKALLEEAANFNEQWEQPGLKNGDVAIPLMLQNKVPNGFETDDTLDVSLRPDEAEEADYEAIPIEEYGKAMLRGMGWSEGAVIGLTNKQAVSVKMPELRPKGLGLGADRKLVEKIKSATSEKQKENKDELSMTVGAPIKLLTGVTKGQYAKIQSFDEDNARVVVKLAVGGKMITISQYSIELVSTKEFDAESKYINNDKYEKFKEQTDAQLKRQAEEEAMKEAERDSRESSKKKGDSRSEKRPVVEGNSKSRSNGQTTSSHLWMETDLRVRVVSKSYKNGKYYKAKVIIEDVEGIDLCSCKTDDGDFLDNLRQDMLETTIPKAKMAVVKIVAGKYKGEVGRVIELDGRKQLARVQLVRQANRIKDFLYDDICEYVCDESYLEEM